MERGRGGRGGGQPQLSEPFFTNEAKGTGLGLYLARELCAANRATLEYVDDGPGPHPPILSRGARAPCAAPPAARRRGRPPMCWWSTTSLISGSSSSSR